MQARVSLGQASRLHPLIPRETPRFTVLYRRRASVEREFGRLKNEWALSPLMETICHEPYAYHQRFASFARAS